MNIVWKFTIRFSEYKWHDMFFRILFVALQEGCKEGSLADGVERCRENSDLYSIIALQVC
jgi:hypothetical protein